MRVNEPVEFVMKGDMVMGMSRGVAKKRDYAHEAALRNGTALPHENDDMTDGTMDGPDDGPNMRPDEGPIWRPHEAENRPIMRLSFDRVCDLASLAVDRYDPTNKAQLLTHLRDIARCYSVTISLRGRGKETSTKTRPDGTTYHIAIMCGVQVRVRPDSYEIFFTELEGRYANCRSWNETSLDNVMTVMTNTLEVMV